ncbi:MAG: 16S rRNA (guanine(966)-N(2))-methyltransferase RsmD [Desulfovibrio sp.]
MRLISGIYGGRIIKTCEGPGYRPATSKVRQSIFSMLQARGIIWPGLRVVDMFAGSGSLAIECLSRGAEEAWFVEKNGKAARLIKENLKTLKVAPKAARVLNKDLFHVLKQTPEKPFGMIFIDPPYGLDLLEPALEKVIKGGWLAEDAFILAEVEAGLDFDPESVEGLTVLTDRLYGQTRIILWQN